MGIREGSAGHITDRSDNQVLKEIGAIFLTHGVTGLALQPQEIFCRPCIAALNQLQ